MTARGTPGLLCLLALLASAPPAAAQGNVKPALQAQRVQDAPVIDGILDDSAWSGAAQPTGAWLSYNPLHGSSIPQQTRVWIAYDTKYLYFAFQCDDPERGRIKTSVTRRDNIWADDWVGLTSSCRGPKSTCRA